jgi:hypothetical protein
MFFHVGVENVGNEEFSEFDFLICGKKIQKVAFFGFEDGQSSRNVIILQRLN